MERLITILTVVVLFWTGYAGAEITWTSFDVDFPDSVGTVGTVITDIEGNNLVGVWDAVGGERGFLYNGSTCIKLDFPSASAEGTTVTGISGGRIVGYYSDSSGNAYGFVYSGNTWAQLDFPKARVTVIDGIDGSNIVGRRSYGIYNATAGSFIFNGTTWEAFDFPGAGDSMLAGISGSNVIGSADGQAVLYNLNTHVLTSLVFPGQPSTTTLLGIDGSNIVGTYNGGLDPILSLDIYHGFLYNGSTWMQLDFPGAISTQVRNIEGNKVVGFYYDGSGNAHGFVAEIPEPATLLLLGLGGMMIRKFKSKS